MGTQHINQSDEWQPPVDEHRTLSSIHQAYARTKPFCLHLTYLTTSAIYYHRIDVRRCRSIFTDSHH